MTELINFISNFQKLDTETEQAINDHFIEETYKKNQYIVEAGKICNKVFFIKSGFVRRFFVNSGQEVTIWFYDCNQMVTSMPSFFGQKPANEYLQACEKTTIYSLSFQDEEKLLEDYPLFAKFHLKLPCWN
jgi:CRP-like cAMP-binding protein